MEEEWKEKFLAARISSILDGVRNYVKKQPMMVELFRSGYGKENVKEDLQPYFFEAYELFKKGFVRSSIEAYFEQSLDPKSSDYQPIKKVLNLILDEGEEEFRCSRR
ncbi:MAG: hypothetical protein QMD14_03490 [Candidatus Aenigmarchaeota archaeon]|nr:hypothetical protein [Candidatus Aenigmarchaeota archaeon]